PPVQGLRQNLGGQGRPPLLASAVEARAPDFFTAAHRKSSSSTSKMSVAWAGIFGGCPRAP
ncbi:MAG: hypothetical protein RLZZ15_2014, partial [Verrucomicrobiota bacterium]